MSNGWGSHREGRLAAPFDGLDAATDADARRLVASELMGVVEHPRFLSYTGLWATLVASEPRGGERVLMCVRPRASLDDEVVGHVLQAVTAGRRIRHAAVLPVRRFGRTERLVWLSMPELGGRPLRQWFSKERAPLAATALELLRAATAPLAAIHDAGLVHGALTLSAFHRDGSGVVRVSSPGVDLALLRGDLAAGRTSEATRLAAPELEAEQEPTAASDQYALAAILVELIAGRVYSRQDDHLPSGVPERWGPVLRRALDADPDARWGSVRALARALDPSTPRPARTSAVARGRGRPGTLDVYQPSGFRRRGGRSSRLEAADEIAAFPILLPPLHQGEPEAGALRAQAASRTPPARRLLAAFLLLLVVGAAGLARIEDPEALVARVLSATPLEARASRTSRVTTEAGRLWLQSDPSGTVFIDDELMGDTPLLDHPVPAGEHVIRIERSTYDPYFHRVTLQPGDTLRLTDIVLEGGDASTVPD